MHRLAFADLGFTRRMRAQIRAALVRRPAGLLLFSSVRGHGRSSTLHAVLFDFNPYPRPGRSMRGEERPPAGRLSIVEDIDDARTAEIVRERLAKGETVFATTVATSGADALASMRSFGFAEAELARDLRGCIHQYLAPRACPACSVPIWTRTALAAAHAGTLGELAAGADAEFSFLSARTCPACAGGAAPGAIGVFEWIEPAASPADEARPGGEDAGPGPRGITLREDLLEKLRAHAITIEAAADLLWQLEN